MEINGVDKEIASGHDQKETLLRVVQSILKIWKDGVIQDTETSQEFSDIQEFYESDTKEIFVYKNQDAKSAWKDYGWTHDHCKSMIHVFMCKDSILNMVVQDPSDEETLEILKEIKLRISP